MIDLGSGGGLPGLVIAVDRPDLRLTLLDARQKRTDQLRRLVGRLGLASRVEVVCDRVERFGARVTEPYDVLVARKFGPPTEVVAAARLLVRPAGLIVVSDAPDDRWELTVVAERLHRLPAPDGLVVARLPEGPDPSRAPDLPA